MTDRTAIVGFGFAIPGTDREENRYHDSYFWIRYWDDEAGVIKSAQYGATAWPSPTMYPADGYLDLTSEAGERFLAFLRAGYAKSAAKSLRASLMPIAEHGARVRVIKPLTRGKNKTAAGVTGTVAWIGDKKTSRYGSPYERYLSAAFAPKVLGVDLDDETEEWNGKVKARRIFIDSDRVEAEVFVAEDDPRVIAAHDKVLAAAEEMDPVKLIAAAMGLYESGVQFAAANAEKARAHARAA